MNKEGNAFSGNFGKKRSLVQRKTTTAIKNNVENKQTNQINLVKTTSKSLVKDKQINIPIFIKAASKTDDPFWKTKLLEAYKGIFPRFFSYKNQYLIYQEVDTKNTITMFVPNDPEGAKDTLISFFQDYGKIYPPSYENYQPISNQEQKKTLTWSDYKKKDKEHMIFFYIDNLKNKMKLDNNQYDDLYNLIIQGIETKKVLNKTNIIVDNYNRITEIKGLLYDPVNKIFYLDSKLVPKITKKKKSVNKIHDSTELDFHKNEKPFLMQKWKKYLEVIEKEHKKNKSSGIYTDINTEKNSLIESVCDDYDDYESVTETESMSIYI